MAWARQRALRLPRREYSGTRAPIALLHALLLWAASGRFRLPTPINAKLWLSVTMKLCCFWGVCMQCCDMLT